MFLIRVSWNLSKIKQLKILSQCLLIRNMQWQKASPVFKNWRDFLSFFLWNDPLLRLCGSVTLCKLFVQICTGVSLVLGAGATKMWLWSLLWDILAIVIQCIIKLYFCVYKFWMQTQIWPFWVSGEGPSGRTAYFRVISLITWHVLETREAQIWIKLNLIFLKYML